jgi:hypothetical protein
MAVHAVSAFAAIKGIPTEGGVIFVSIDDNEAAWLTIVFDELFRCRIASTADSR